MVRIVGLLKVFKRVGLGNIQVGNNNMFYWNDQLYTNNNKMLQVKKKGQFIPCTGLQHMNEHSLMYESVSCHDNHELGA